MPASEVAGRVWSFFPEKAVHYAARRKADTPSLYRNYLAFNRNFLPISTALFHSCRMT
jgi:hypothetical protein